MAPKNKILKTRSNLGIKHLTYLIACSILVIPSFSSLCQANSNSLHSNTFTITLEPEFKLSHSSNVGSSSNNNGGSGSNGSGNSGGNSNGGGNSNNSNNNGNPGNSNPPSTNNNSNSSGGGSSSTPWTPNNTYPAESNNTFKKNLQPVVTHKTPNQPAKKTLTILSEQASETPSNNQNHQPINAIKNTKQTIPHQTNTLKPAAPKNKENPKPTSIKTQTSKSINHNQKTRSFLKISFIFKKITQLLQHVKTYLGFFSFY